MRVGFWLWGLMGSAGPGSSTQHLGSRQTSLLAVPFCVWSLFPISLTGVVLWDPSLPRMGKTWRGLTVFFYSTPHHEKALDFMSCPTHPVRPRKPTLKITGHRGLAVGPGRFVTHLISSVNSFILFKTLQPEENPQRNPTWRAFYNIPDQHSSKQSKLMKDKGRLRNVLVQRRLKWHDNLMHRITWTGFWNGRSWSTPHEAWSLAHSDVPMLLT